MNHRSADEYFREVEVNGETEYLMSIKGVVVFTLRTYKSETEERPKETAALFVKELLQILKEKGLEVSAPKMLMRIRTANDDELYEIADEISESLDASDIERMFNSKGVM